MPALPPVTTTWNAAFLGTARSQPCSLRITVATSAAVTEEPSRRPVRAAKRSGRWTCWASRGAPTHQEPTSATTHDADAASTGSYGACAFTGRPAEPSASTTRWSVSAARERASSGAKPWHFPSRMHLTAVTTDPGRWRRSATNGTRLLTRKSRRWSAPGGQIRVVVVQSTRWSRAAHAAARRTISVVFPPAPMSQTSRYRSRSFTVGPGENGSGLLQERPR